MRSTTMAAVLAVTASGRAGVCDHASLTYLGSGGNVSYLQCDDCSTVLVRTGDRAWVLRPS